MKKITLLLIIILCFSSYSQEKKTFTSKSELLNSAQSSFISSIHNYYPEFILPMKVLNVYGQDKQIAESYIEYSKTPNDSDEYLIVLNSENNRLDYEYVYAEGNGNLKVRGSYYILGTDIYKVDLSIKGKSKNFFILYKNGKEVFADNPYKSLLKADK
ncbi:hypothetical protein ACEN2I_02055 [Flavobacterium sp. W22_SRS_FK3]|uniref:hypothetical protein n=1 Tax=Flavobacterium sp. W22_SRS_FK3 TaxID=3240275 RepID=UPI003F8F3C45